MKKINSLLAITLGTLSFATLPILAQDAPATPAAPAPQATTATTKTFSPEENAAINSYTKKTAVQLFRLMGNLDPSVLMAQDNNYTPDVLKMTKTCNSIPAPEALPAFWKANIKQELLLIDQLLKKIQDKAPEAEQAKLRYELESLDEQFKQDLAPYGLTEQSIMENVLGGKMETKMGELAQKLMKSNPVAMKDQTLMMNALFNLLANEIEQSKTPTPTPTPTPTAK